MLSSLTVGNTEVKAIWSYMISVDTVKLATVRFFDE
jgi:hypothetical protein